MQYNIKLHANNIEKTLRAGEGTNLLQLLQENGVILNTPCAGKGTCGKCAVRVAGELNTPSDKEKSLLGAGRLEKGYRLACYTHISTDLEIYTDGDKREASIITEGRMRNVRLGPVVRKKYIELEPPSLEDQRPDLERVLDVLKLQAVSDASISGEALPIGAAHAAESIAVNTEQQNLDLIKELPGILKASGYKITAVLTNGRLAAVEPGNTTDRLYGLAVDIGTTTVAAYLYDLASGKLVSTGSMLNPQRRYGADVISRIGHTIRSESGRAELQSLITECIGRLAAGMTERAEISINDIYAAVFAGNTTMLHMLLGLDAAGIAAAPFIPVTTGEVWFSPKDIGLPFNRFGTAMVFPGVSAYVGGDIVAAVLSSGIYEEEGVSLLVDIGTNGEMVLGGREWLLACSTAAGPAFEGANIRNGIGGVTGAIDSVGSAPDFKCSVIGNTKPVGICGSGIVDAVAALIDAGLLDETGRILDVDEAEADEEVIQRLVSIDGTRAFVLHGGAAQNGGVNQTDDVGPDEPIVITQRDVREIQNAKAAIAAGIDTLVREAGISPDDIRKVYLAGGFGSSLHIATAVRIGLLPKALENRIETIGNASGTGASEGLLSSASLKTAESLPRRIKYIELSASAYFTEKYVDNMLF